MVKTNHMLLAKALLQAQGGFSASRFETAFLYGSISPDCNPFTYFRGSIEHRFLHGHNYVNARRWVFKALERLQRRTTWNTWDYYTLGKITHYLADAFVYPHNENYPYGPVEHRMYEVAFRSQFKVYMGEHQLEAAAPSANVIQSIMRLHYQYEQVASELVRDMDYIIKTNLMVMASCLPTVPAQVKIV